MADMRFTATITPVSFSTSTVTLDQLVAATNVRVKVSEWDISFNGTSNTATPIEVDIIRQTSAGTSSALTLRKADTDLTETLQTTALQTFTAEPTNAGDIPFSEQVHPQTGYTWQAPFGGEWKVPGAGRLGLRLVTPGAGASAACRFVGEE